MSAEMDEVLHAVGSYIRLVRGDLAEAQDGRDEAWNENTELRGELHAVRGRLDTATADNNRLRDEISDLKQVTARDEQELRLYGEIDKRLLDYIGTQLPLIIAAERTKAGKVALGHVLARLREIVGVALKPDGQS